MILLATAYFGNIQYYSKLYSGETVLIEENENYTKQSYRNRCDILSGNGVISLSIPVKKDYREKTPIKEVEIDHVMEWQKQHWRSISSAYGSSPYFEFYDYLFEPLFKKKEKYLIDHNNKCMEIVCGCINKKIEAGKTEFFREPGCDDTILDYRQSISPKAALRKEDPYYRDIEYYQVFSEKFPFQKNLSILDLLFCEGNNTHELLKESYIWKK